MFISDEWSDELELQWQHWAYERHVWSNYHEPHLHPDQRLDEVGWQIAYYHVQRGWSIEKAAREGLNGTYRQRLRVRDDLARRYVIQLDRRYTELHPAHVGIGVFDTQAPEQLDFWSRHLPSSDFVYFIQDGETGPVKIGLSNDPGSRVRKLQTGNPRELHLRHVIPGDRGIERQLHDRFRPALVRGEWFGGAEYLPIILAFGSGLADEMIHGYDGSGHPPILTHGHVVSPREVERLRREIERLWREGHSDVAIAGILRLSLEELDEHLEAMRASTLYDVRYAGGYLYLGGRIVPARDELSRQRARRRRGSQAA